MVFEKNRRLGCSNPGSARQAFLRQGGQLFLSHSLTPTHQGRTVKNLGILENTIQK
jgi:hypothetical protein